jgi:crotonobetainyl-CoA:carnitine CoA-transferase CaiB-like acyl-CoA transferase
LCGPAIQIEAPGGDMCACGDFSFARPFWLGYVLPILPMKPGGAAGRGFGASFGNENRGKKSVVIDIKDPEQLAVLRAMLRDSDGDNTFCALVAKP